MDGIEISNPEQENPAAVIAEIKQEAAMMGRNDVEPSLFKEIEKGFSAGKYSAKEAIAMARQVLYGKQEH